MKKIVSLILVLGLCLSLCACGGGNDTPTPTQNSTPTEATEAVPTTTWSVQQTVDEFGDVTADSATVIEAPISGDFSNTATASSELSGYVRFTKKPNSDHYIAQFVLLEYNNTPATYNSGDSLSMKVKIGDTITDLTLTGEAPNGSLFLGISAFDYAADYLFDELYLGLDLRCIIYIGSSQYNFTIACDNFTELCDAEGFPMAPAQMTVKEAVDIFVTENGPYMGAAVDIFTNGIENFEIANTDELTTALYGNFFEIQIDDFAPYWTIKNYDNSTTSQIAFMEYNAYGRGFEDTSESISRGDYEFRTDNNLMTVVFGGGITESYQVRKLSDDVFVTYEPNDNGEYIIPAKLMIRYNDVVSSTTDVYDNMLPYIQNTLIPQIG